jgi:hypothetical protein
MQAGGTQPLEPELSVEAAGRWEGAPATVRASRGAAAIWLSAPGLAPGQERPCDESQEALAHLSRGKTHGAPAWPAQASDRYAGTA